MSSKILITFFLLSHLGVFNLIFTLWHHYISILPDKQMEKGPRTLSNIFTDGTLCNILKNEAFLCKIFKDESFLYNAFKDEGLLHNTFKDERFRNNKLKMRV